MLRPFLLPLLVGLMSATSASPCGFHNYAPQPTLVDQLLGSDEIVLARSAAGNLFRFEAFEALEGELGLSEIPFLVGSTTRRKFALDPNASVLFARDGAYGPWKRLAFVDAATAPVIETIMERLPAWEFGDDPDRFGYFASLVDHPDDRIHRIALRELDLADYSILRDLHLAIEPSRLLKRLNDPLDSEFKPIRILLLGFSGDEQLRNLLEKGVASSVLSEGRYLGAYTTALIELAGPDAVTDIASSYLTDRRIPLLTRELLIEAIALHGQTRDPAMENAIQEAIESTLWVDPGLAGAVARRFGGRGDWSHHSALQMLLEEGNVHSPADAQDVSQYVMLARESVVNH